MTQEKKLTRLKTKENIDKILALKKDKLKISP